MTLIDHFQIFVPSHSSKESYIFKVMCEGGVVGDRVFNTLTENVVIMKNGSAPRSYKDFCPVTKTKYNFTKYLILLLGSSFLHYNMDGG